MVEITGGRRMMELLIAVIILGSIFLAIFEVLIIWFAGDLLNHGIRDFREALKDKRRYGGK